jgi:hypothetical protein
MRLIVKQNNALNLRHEFGNPSSPTILSMLRLEHKLESRILRRNQVETVTLDQAVDDLIIFVGAGSLTNAAAVAIPADINGSPLSDRFTSSDFQPWAGTIIFDSNFDGFANLSLAIHEIGHLLGIGIAPAFDALNQNGLFNGSMARAINGGQPIPLADGHIRADFQLPNGLRPVVGGGIGSGLPTLADLAVLVDIGYQVPALQSGVIPSTLNYVVAGTSGKDFLFGFDGSDRLIGLAGDDTLYGFKDGNEAADQSDSLDGGEGNDFLNGGSGDDLLIGGAGEDILIGGAGQDKFGFNPSSGNDRIDDFTAAEDAIQLSTAFGFTSSAEVLRSIPAAQEVLLGSDRRLLSVLTLGAGNKVEIIHDAPLSASNFRLQDLPQIEVVGSNPSPTSNPTSNPTPSSTSNPTVTDSKPTIRSKGVQLNGNAKRNRLKGSDGDDVINGKGGQDRIVGLGGSDTLLGGSGHDLLFGNDGDDILQGGSGKDSLNGGLGSDILIGGGDRDSFVLEAGIGVDTIRGFRVAQDVLALGKGIRREQLSLTQQANDTLISFNQDALAIVTGVQAICWHALSFPGHRMETVATA